MLKKIINAINRFLQKCTDDHIAAFAAQSAFFIILSFIPFVMLFISLVQYTPISESFVSSIVERTMPSYISGYLVSIIQEVYSRGIGTISITAITAIWAAATGIQCLAFGLNCAYGMKETRNYFYLRFRAMLYTLGLVIALILSLLLLIFGNSIQNLLAHYLPFIGKLTKVILAFRMLILLVVFIFFFALLYKAFPNRKATLVSQLPGSILCAVAWYVFSYALSVYVDDFNGFSMYGSLTTIVLVMLWLYFCMYILLICGEINNILEKWTGPGAKSVETLDSAAKTMETSSSNVSFAEASGTDATPAEASDTAASPVEASGIDAKSAEASCTNATPAETSASDASLQNFR